MYLEEQIRKETAIRVAQLMLTAARTAPKARGTDNIVLAIAEQSEIVEIAKRMEEIGNRPNGPAFFLRDAANILQSQALVLMGTRIKAQELQICGRCGYENCEEKNKFPDIPCTFNTGDLGIAMGSAVSVATDQRIDNRIMYTVGQAVLELRLLGEDVRIAFGIPLSISPKNPFFDRK
ncbi:MAG: DUF2148 domain-containing protein [Bacteroidales bacterium]|jgi:uncharacterized ferredoxin-like protein|nr:DUF2148 domain-containing protein [Bacteroidales bacterium]